MIVDVAIINNVPQRGGDWVDRGRDGSGRSWHD